MYKQKNHSSTDRGNRSLLLLLLAASGRLRRRCHSSTGLTSLQLGDQLTGVEQQRSSCKAVGWPEFLGKLQPTCNEFSLDGGAIVVLQLHTNASLCVAVAIRIQWVHLIFLKTKSGVHDNATPWVHLKFAFESCVRENIVDFLCRRVLNALNGINATQCCVSVDLRCP